MSCLPSLLPQGSGSLGECSGLFPVQDCIPQAYPGVNTVPQFPCSTGTPVKYRRLSFTLNKTRAALTNLSEQTFQVVFYTGYFPSFPLFSAEPLSSHENRKLSFFFFFFILIGNIFLPESLGCGSTTLCRVYVS